MRARGAAPLITRTSDSLTTATPFKLGSLDTSNPVTVASNTELPTRGAQAAAQKHASAVSWDRMKMAQTTATAVLTLGEPIRVMATATLAGPRGHEKPLPVPNLAAQGN